MIQESDSDMQDLVARSLSILQAGQASSGAYVASPNYPTYQYCWFRDGTFIAHAMDLWQNHASASRFYEWAIELITANATLVERGLANTAPGKPLDPSALLHTRYTLDGKVSNDEWPDFQLDGFGTLLWGLQQHLILTGQNVLPPPWRPAVGLLIRYLAASWQRPNYDCWEEFADQIAVSTLAALYAGLHAISGVSGLAPTFAEQGWETAERIKEFVLEYGVYDGHLIKQIRGADVVDANLLWACVPFGHNGLLLPTHPLMKRTVACIEQDLIGATGGVHRYRADTFYGGGEWLLLTALLGEYRAAVGDRPGASRCLAYVEAHATAEGYLPEQITSGALWPEHIAEWTARWGTPACPLLWSHAAYLSLFARLRTEEPLPS